MHQCPIVIINISGANIYKFKIKYPMEFLQILVESSVTVDLSVWNPLWHKRSLFCVQQLRQDHGCVKERKYTNYQVSSQHRKNLTGNK